MAAHSTRHSANDADFCERIFVDALMKCCVVREVAPGNALIAPPKRQSSEARPRFQVPQLPQLPLP